MAINKRLINTGGGGVEVPTSFNTVLYDANGGVLSVGGVGFQPDFVWIKQTSGTVNHSIFDTNRGVQKYLLSNDTTAEVVYAGRGLTSFNSDGFTVDDTGALNYAVNHTGTYVAWCWKAGGAAVTNTDGSISSEVSANVDAGFSVVKYTGNGSAATIGHGLNVAPNWIITKRIDASSNWDTYVSTLGASKYIVLDGTNAEIGTTAAAWNNTEPTSSVFSVGTSFSNNRIAYCFAEKAGFSKFGSYSGNGSATGTTVTTDFEPAFVMIKRTDDTGNWVILDNKRDTSNPIDKTLNPNLFAEESNANDIDFNATTFQLKSTNADTNASGTDNYIYMAFANQF